MAKQPTDGRRWRVVAIVSFGYFSTLLALTGISPSFPSIARSLEADYGQMALLISSFLAGLAIGHIPSGLLATRIGVKTALVLGLLTEAVACILSGFADSYAELAVSRFVVGLGASAFASVAVGTISAWFDSQEVALPLGIGTAAMGAGTAAGVYLWTYVDQAFGWRGALIGLGAMNALAGALAIAGLSTPKHLPALEGGPVTAAAIRKTLGNRQLWIYGVAFIGAYGAYMTTTQLLAGYAKTMKQFSLADAALLAGCVGLSGIPGSIAGGWVASRVRHARKLIVGPALGMGALIAALPLVPPAMLWPIALAVGFLMQFMSAVWTSVPRRFAAIAHEHVSTAMGLLLTISAFGGFFVPMIFGGLLAAGRYSIGWMSLGGICAAFALVGLLGSESDQQDADEPRTEPRA